MAQTQKALALICEALDLLSEKLECQTKEPVPIRGQGLCAILKWIELHDQHRKYWQVHAFGDKSGSDRNKAFFDASDAGHSDVCRWLLKTQKWLVFTNEFRVAFYGSTHCPMKVIKILQELGFPKSDDMCAFKYIADALRWAAEHNSIEMCRLLKDWKKGCCNPRANDNIALRYAAFNGNVEILRFLKDHWNLTTEDARADNNYALRYASQNGHVDVLRFLKDNWNLTTEDARALNNYALRYAARNGHVEVLKFLKDQWNLTTEDARAEGNWALTDASENGHIEVLKFLEDQWNLTADDARAGSNRALRGAARCGHIKVLQFLKDQWNLTADDARSGGNQALHLAAHNGHIEVLQILRDSFGLTVEDARVGTVISQAAMNKQFKAVQFLVNWIYAAEEPPKTVPKTNVGVIKCEHLAPLQLATKTGTSVVLLYASDCGASGHYVPGFYEAATKATVPFYAIDESTEQAGNHFARSLPGFPVILKIMNGEVAITLLASMSIKAEDILKHLCLN